MSSPRVMELELEHKHEHELSPVTKQKLKMRDDLHGHDAFYVIKEVGFVGDAVVVHQQSGYGRHEFIQYPLSSDREPTVSPAKNERYLFIEHNNKAQFLTLTYDFSGQFADNLKIELHNLDGSINTEFGTTYLNWKMNSLHDLFKVNIKHIPDERLLKVAFFSGKCISLHHFTNGEIHPLKESKKFEIIRYQATKYNIPSRAEFLPISGNQFLVGEHEVDKLILWDSDKDQYGEIKLEGPLHIPYGDPHCHPHLQSLPVVELFPNNVLIFFPDKKDSNRTCAQLWDVTDISSPKLTKSNSLSLLDIGYVPVEDRIKAFWFPEETAINLFLNQIYRFIRLDDKGNILIPTHNALWVYNIDMEKPIKLADCDFHPTREFKSCLKTGKVFISGNDDFQIIDVFNSKVYQEVREKQQEMEKELEKHREMERENAEKERQSEIAKQQEMEREKAEKERLSEIAKKQEMERLCEIARQQELEREKERLSEIAKQQEMEREKEKLCEIARQKEMEREKQRQRLEASKSKPDVTDTAATLGDWEQQFQESSTAKKDVPIDTALTPEPDAAVWDEQFQKSLAAKQLEKDKTTDTAIVTSAHITTAMTDLDKEEKHTSDMTTQQRKKLEKEALAKLQQEEVQKQDELLSEYYSGADADYLGASLTSAPSESSRSASQSGVPSLGRDIPRAITTTLFEKAPISTASSSVQQHDGKANGQVRVSIGHNSIFPPKPQLKIISAASSAPRTSTSREYNVAGRGQAPRVKFRACAVNVAGGRQETRYVPSSNL